MKNFIKNSIGVLLIVLMVKICADLSSFENVVSVFIGMSILRWINEDIKASKNSK